MKVLDDRREEILAQYLARGDSVRFAALQAGLGYGKALKLEREPRIVDRIREIQGDEAGFSTVIAQRKLQEEYPRIAFSDPRALYDEQGKQKQPYDLDVDTAAAIASVRYTEYGIEYKFHNKVTAMADFAKLLGMTTERFQMVGGDGKPLEKLTIEFVEPPVRDG